MCNYPAIFYFSQPQTSRSVCINTQEQGGTRKLAVRSGIVAYLHKLGMPVAPELPPAALFPSILPQRCGALLLSLHTQLI